MKVLILNPPAVDDIRIIREGRCMQRQEAWGTTWAPLTLAIIAAILREVGFIVELKDCSNDKISFEDLKHILQEFGPHLVIVNTSTPSISSDLKVANLTKEIDKGIRTVFFGIHVTALPETVFKENSNVEFIVSGEPEYTLRDFALALRDKHPISRVKRLIYRANDEIIYNRKRLAIENLDELPCPAWDLINIDGYRLPITNRPFLLVLTERGCPYSCKFCAAGILYGQKIRLRSWRIIVDEIKYVRAKYKINDFLFWSENAIADRQHMYEIAQGLAKEVPGLRWICNGRVDGVDKDLLEIMKKAGCWMIGYGVEAGSQRILDLMRKRITIRDIEEAVQLTKQAGIEITAHTVVGYPGETKEDILSTIKLLKRLNPDYIQVYCCVPFPGSPLYNEAKKNDWLSSADWSRYEQGFSVISTPSLSAHTVMRLKEKIIKDFYFRPGKILKMLSKIRSGQEMVFFLRFADRYFRSWVKKQ